MHEHPSNFDPLTVRAGSGDPAGTGLETGLTQPFAYNPWAIAGVGCIGLLAFLLRIFHLGEENLWFDEVLSFHTATLDPGFAEFLRLDNSPPLYYLLLRYWLPLAGTSEAAVRFPSAVAGTLCVLAVMWAGRQIFNPAVGLWAGGFVAVAPLQVYYSQEARVYAVLILALALTYGLLWRAMRLNTWSSWGLVSAAALAALYSHYLAVIALAPAVLVLLAWPRDAETQRRRARFFAASLLCGVLLSPWLIWTFVLNSHAHTITSTEWIASYWRETPPILAIPRSLEVFALGPQAHIFPVPYKQFTQVVYPAPLRMLGIVLLAALALWVAVPWQDSGLNVPWLGRRKAWTASLLALPLTILWVGSLLHPLYLVGRYDLVAFPGYALLLGVALAKLHAVRRFGNALAVLAGLGLLVPIGTKLALYYQVPAENHARQMAQAIDLLVKDGDVLVLSGQTGPLMFGYYLPRLEYEWKNGTCRSIPRNREFTCRMFPLEMEKTFLPSTEVSPGKVRADVEAFLSPIEASKGNLWVILGAVRIVNGGRIAHTAADRLLAEELRGVGFQPDPVPTMEVPSMFLFRRSTS